MRFGVCTSYDKASELCDMPVDYIEENVQRFLCPERPREEFAGHLARASALPLPIEAANSLLPPDMTLVATSARQVDHARIEAYMRTALERAAQAGIRVLVFGSGTARACPTGVARDDAERQIGARLATWSAWARDYDVQIALEPLRYEETNTLNTVAEGGALITSIAASGATLLADIYHMACNGEASDSLEPYGPLLAHVHVAEQRDRAAPGRYGEDFRPYFAALRRAGYDRRISVECHWQDVVAEVGPAMATLRAQWADSNEA